MDEPTSWKRVRRQDDQAAAPARPGHPTTASRQLQQQPERRPIFIGRTWEHHDLPDLGRLGVGAVVEKHDLAIRKGAGADEDAVRQSPCQRVTEVSVKVNSTCLADGSRNRTFSARNFPIQVTPK
ncbi:MAG: hypothetical protein WAL35_00695, partial [Acidimicrobiales bacterium]